VLELRGDGTFSVTNDPTWTDASASVMSSTTNRSQAKPTRVTFWNVMYPKVKQELQRKYPRHEWR
jgi:hypothetical protein